MSAAELARQCDVPTKRVSEILDGGPAITSDTALRLAPFLRNDSRILANLQIFYELRIAEKNVRKSTDRLASRQLRHPSQGIVDELICNDKGNQVLLIKYPMPN